MSSRTAVGFEPGVGFELSKVLQAVPAVTTALTTKGCYIFQFSVTNGTGADVTVTIQDGLGGYLMKATNIVSATTVSFNWDEGQFMSGGITWSASATGLWAGVMVFTRS